MKKYPKYKDSGVEWVGLMPEGWNVVKPWTIFKPENREPQLSDEIVTCFRDGIVTLRKNRREDGFTNSLKEIGYQRIFVGDLVVHEMDGFEGSIGVSDSVGKSTPVYTVIAEGDKHINRYWMYQLREMARSRFIESLSKSIRERTTEFRWNTWKNQKFLSPPIPEQKQIVTFLDHKTTLIDQIISGSEKKIKLLKEQRTATINHAVTKGLNPKVKMKDSGVEWIGDIPEGWTIVPLKSITDVRPSNVDKHIYPEEIQVDLCNYTDVYKNEFVGLKTLLKQGSCSEAEYSRFTLKKGDVIITKDSESPDDIGIPCLIIDDLPNVVCGYHLTLLRPVNIEGRFLYRVFHTQYIKSYFETESNGITRFALGKSSIESTSIVFPPIQEQQQIVTYLDQKTKEIDDLISSEQKRIELMKEYRQSLISEVVTGKIDVRTN